MDAWNNGTANVARKHYMEQIDLPAREPGFKSAPELARCKMHTVATIVTLSQRLGTKVDVCRQLFVDNTKFTPIMIGLCRRPEKAYGDEFGGVMSETGTFVGAYSEVTFSLQT